MVEIKKRLDNDDHCGCNNPTYIVIHDTGNYTDSDEGNANYFCTGTRDASAHYFVDDDSITQLVEDYNGSYHCGDGNGIYGITNHNSIGIEMCRVEGTTTQITRQNTIELISILMKKHNIPIDRVVRHYDASRKNCPSSLSYNNWSGWRDFKDSLYSYINNKQSLIKDFMLDSTGQYGRINTLEVSSNTANVEFKFTVKNNSDGRTIIIQDYSTNKKVTYTPSYRGTHIFTVYAKKGSQEELKEIVREIISKCTVKDFNVSEGDNVGQVLKLSASATESPFALYRFIYINRLDGRWLTAQDWSEKNTCEYSPSYKGLHRFVVHVKHINSDTQDQDDYKYIDREIFDNKCNHDEEINELKKENDDLKNKLENIKNIVD